MEGKVITNVVIAHTGMEIPRDNAQIIRNIPLLKMSSLSNFLLKHYQIFPYETLNWIIASLAEFGRTVFGIHIPQRF